MTRVIDDELQIIGNSLKCHSQSADCHIERAGKSGFLEFRNFRSSTASPSSRKARKVKLANASTVGREIGALMCLQRRRSCESLLLKKKLPRVAVGAVTPQLDKYYFINVPTIRQFSYQLNSIS